MRTLLILTFVVFSMGAMTALEGPGRIPESFGAKVAHAQAGTLTGAVTFVRKIKSHLSTDQTTQTWSEPPSRDQDALRLGVGERLPEGTELYAIPRHESYRYAIVQDHRVIVDAASRRIVYIIR